MAPKMWPLEAICLSTYWLNRVDISIHRVFSVSEFSNKFGQPFSSKRRSLLARTLNQYLQKMRSETSGCGLTRLWFLLAIEAGKTNVFSRVSESKVQRVWASIDVDEIQFWERFSGADFFSLRVDNSRVGNIVWLTVLILKARKH